MFLKINRLNQALMFVILSQINFLAMAAEKEYRVRHGLYKAINPYRGAGPLIVKACVRCSKGELELGGYKLRKCGGNCNGIAWYCSKECQREDWKNHKKEDGCFKKS